MMTIAEAITIAAWLLTALLATESPRFPKDRDGYARRRTKFA